ncbi:hypothetical protein MYSE111917_26435 [Mycobacterium senriense]|uniref:Uncharacterized protein n=1 Tax=Mycobacterium senriense TaxID=2775496 RepID=A0ABN6IDI8_9MYCO|nr:hypothetical protein MTY59_15650 [Mycobacterium senriense]
MWSGRSGSTIEYVVLARLVRKVGERGRAHLARPIDMGRRHTGLMGTEMAPMGDSKTC